MPRRKTLTDAAIAKLEPKAKTYTVPDPELPGLYVRVWPSGVKSFAAVARAPHGKQVWHSIGASPVVTIAQARTEARKAITAIRAGESRKGAQTVSIVAGQWLKRHVEANGLRSARRISRDLDRYILPAWGNRGFAGIKRGDVAELLDSIEDSAGPVAADKVLAHISKLCNWYATRHDNYSSPVVKGMRRSNPKERARERILNDDEIRTVWKAAESNGTFGAFLRLALLTAQRREKVAAMRWQDIAIDGTWTIPAEAREKGNARELVLPGAALDIINAQPRFADNPFVFAGRGNSHFSGYSKSKAAFDAKVRLAQWQLHDLRRTARSLMSRAGIRPDIAERVLGHAIAGVEGVYDRHQYRDEKSDALRSLAALVSSIIKPPADNVVPIAGVRQ